MKRCLAPVFAVTVLFATAAHAQNPKVEVAIAVDGDTRPATVFPADVPKLMAFFLTTGTGAGDELNGKWIAEDVGDAAPAETLIDEATVVGDKSDFTGAFSMSKPTAGWPVGKYRVEVYSGETLVATAPFVIEAAE